MGKITKEQVRADVREKVAELTELELEELEDSARFIEDLDVDSLTAIELLVALEKEYKVRFTDEEFGELKNIQEVVEGVMQRLEAPQES